MKKTEEQRSDQTLNLEMAYGDFYIGKDLCASVDSAEFWERRRLLASVRFTVLNFFSEAFKEGMAHAFLSRLQKGSEFFLCF